MRDYYYAKEARARSPILQVIYQRRILPIANLATLGILGPYGFVRTQSPGTDTPRSAVGRADASAHAG